MKLTTLRRSSVSAAAVVALSLSFAACSSEDDDASGTATDTESSSAPAETESTSADTETEDAAAEPFGPACSALPAAGEAGSLESMTVDPVGTAAGTNPVLTTLTAAIGSIDGLGDTLNDQEALTVFAPIDDPAFAAIPKKTLNGLVKGGTQDGTDSALYQILAHHVLPERFEPGDIDGEHDTLNGDTVTVTGDENGMTVTGGGPNAVEANVLCGGIQTANATVYVIDAVLTDGTVNE